MAKKQSNQRIEIYDTTLRDGAQMEGVAFSLEDKLLIARKLDELGVDYIEGGYPLSNQKDIAFFREIRKLGLKHSRVAAFGMTRKKGVKAEDDVGMIALQKSLAPVITIVANLVVIVYVINPQRLNLLSDLGLSPGLTPLPQLIGLP